MSSSRIALKEWAVVCDAVASRQQLILFRKGGIHEGPAGFRPEHDEFWLFPTGFHQSLDTVLQPFQARARQVIENPPPTGHLLLQHYCRIERTIWIDDEAQLARLFPSQILASDALLTRFRYRRPGLFVIRVSVRSLPEAVLIPVHPDYDGCHSWVELKSPISLQSLQDPPLTSEQQQRLETLTQVFPDLR